MPQLELSVHSLREHHFIGQMQTKAERFKNGFYPNCLNEWDKAPSLSIFKYKILALIRRPSKPVYGIHGPGGFSYTVKSQSQQTKFSQIEA